MLTRRCTMRMFLLRPDEETNNAFVYCLAEAAQKFEITVLLSQMMSNHHHTTIYDRDGRYVEFMERFHKLLAKCQNALRGRFDNLWSATEPSVVELGTPEDILENLVYVATNPVNAGLVEAVHHWPGPPFLRALLRGETLRAVRPWFFFSEAGTMPETVELTLGLPPEIGDHATVLAEIKHRVQLCEAAAAKERLSTGGRVFGRGRIRRQPWQGRPSTCEPRRTLRPRVAARDASVRITLLCRNREFALAYRAARKLWLAGEAVTFPFGTYWLRRFANVPVAPPLTH